MHLSPDAHSNNNIKGTVARNEDNLKQNSKQENEGLEISLATKEHKDHKKYQLSLEVTLTEKIRIS